MKNKVKSLGQIYDEKWSKKLTKDQPQINNYISQIRNELAVYLPEFWQGKIKAEKYEHGILFITLGSAAYKIRFNQIRLDLLSHFRSIVPELISIKESIKPIEKAPQSPSIQQTAVVQPKQVSNPVSDKTAAILHKAAENLPESLSKALARIAELKK